MKYATIYESPLGQIYLEANNEALIGCWYERQKQFTKKELTEPNDILKRAIQWLNDYFNGKEPDNMPVHFEGTPFQKEVWELLTHIPYGQTTTYGDIAKTIAERRGIKKMSAQAVGNAVGKNPISIIVPCHRVIGTDGKLVGYAGGLDLKEALLKIEQQSSSDMSL